MITSIRPVVIGHKSCSEQIKQLIRETKKLVPNRNVRIIIDTQDYIDKNFYEKVIIQIGTIYESDFIYIEGKTLEETKKNLIKELKKK